MALINFPANPNTNDTYSFGGKTWVYNGSAWDLQTIGSINATPIGNISPSTGAFTTLTATDGNITIKQAQGEAVYAKSGILASGNVDNYSYTVANGAVVLSPSNYTVSPGITATLGIGTTQQISSQMPSIVGGAGITVAGSNNILTISANVSSLPIINNVTSNITLYPTFVNASSGNLSNVYTSNTTISFNPLTQTLSMVNANAASLNLSTPLPVASGGTGLSSVGNNSLLIGNGNTISLITPGPQGSLITSNGNTWLSAVTSTEYVTVAPLAATGNINYDVSAQPILYYTANATGNCTINFRASGSATLNSFMVPGQSVTVAFLLTNGATAYLPTQLQIDGTNITPKYQGGSAWTTGSANAIDSYSFTMIKTADSTYTMLTSQTKFA